MATQKFDIPIGVILLIATFCFSCQKPRCNDAVLNQNEEEVDCGGPCPPCYTCDDGLLNQGETLVDCGGKYCEPCKNEWVSLPFPSTSNSFSKGDIFFWNENEGIVGAYRSRIRTLDGGQTWENISEANSPAPNNSKHIQGYNTLPGMDFYGWTVEQTASGRDPDLVIYYTKTKGISFRKMPFRTAELMYFNHIVGARLIKEDEVIVWGTRIGGPYGVIMKTKDGGGNWDLSPPDQSGQEYLGNIIDVDFGEDGFGMAITKRSKILMTRDWGDSWIIADANGLPTLFMWKEISIAGTGKGVLSGYDFGAEYRLLYTENFGQSWQNAQIPEEHDNEHISWFYDLTFPVENKGWLLVKRGSDFSTCLRTTDGGKNWSDFSLAGYDSLHRHPTVRALDRISFPSEKIGFAAHLPLVAKVQVAE